MDTLVTYQCMAASHRAADGGGPDKLTVHEGQWAFCAYDAKADGHEWRPTGGLPLSMLRLSASVRAKGPLKGGVK